MSIFNGIDIAASALTAYRRWMDVISSNLANVETTRTAEGGPYRRQAPVFAEVLASSSDQAGGGVRIAEIAEDSSAARMVYQPGHPDANAEGYVAFPNVNAVREMADMLVASRTYEANLAVADSAKNMWNGALDILRG